MSDDKKKIAKDIEKSIIKGIEQTPKIGDFVNERFGMPVKKVPKALSDQGTQQPADSKREDKPLKKNTD